jgi:hypothetical protein
MEVEESPDLEEITGSIAYELEETFKSHGIKVQNWDDLGSIEMKFPDGRKFTIDIVESTGDDGFDEDDDA